MADKCPVCASELKAKQEGPDGRDVTVFSCPLCGDYIFSGTLVADLPHTLETNKDASTKISHAIRMMQQVKRNPELYSNTVEEILKRPLPKPREQADLFIRWLAENIGGPGETVWVEPTTHRTIMGAKTPEGFALILRHLFDIDLVTGNFSEAMGAPGRAHATLSFDGWDYYEQLQHGEGEYRKAFMAMKIGVEELNTILEDVFKPAVLQTGFELQLISDAPKAGLIDDRLRVEIQASDFIIADLTHDNLGAYWEAGYAEGLGKPVIYTCEKKKFEEEKTHFDTNHHLTVIWDSDNPQQAGEDLKATVRATLPHLAKQEDE
ncbi:MAG: hypothetical protein IIA06_08495 [Proteobacteria bacterium]|nr:hypothetical protein [Pseudomonadota bacterium]MCH8977046.1 hypothetical protein [Pseudomonadota bacterium]